MDDEPKPSSSEEIIASLITEVQQSKQPFDVTSLLTVCPKEVKKDSESRSPSPSPKREKKEKKHKEKKSKKSKKWKRTPSRSPSRKKKKRRDRSRSASRENVRPKEDGNDVLEKQTFVKTGLERITDDEDDLPVGADFRTLSFAVEEKDSPEIDFNPRAVSPDVNKRREFVRKEEFFPLSKPKKRKERSESPPIQIKVRPLSEILAKVRAEKSAAFVPRNVKLKQDVAKSNAGIPNGSDNALATLKDSEDSGNEEYGPRPAPAPSGPLPISEDDDENEATFSGKLDIAHPKTIRIGALSEATVEKVTGKRSFEHNGEVPVSEESASERGELSGENKKSRNSEDRLTSHRGSISEHDKKDRKKSKHEKKRKKEKRKNKKEKEKEKEKEREKEKEKKKHSDQVSSSSDSEREWERLRKRQQTRDSVSPRGDNFRFAGGNNDFRLFKRRGERQDGPFNGRKSRDKRLWNQGEKAFRSDANRRRPQDRRRFQRRRSSTLSEKRRSRSHSRSRSRSRSRNYSSDSSQQRSSRSRSRARTKSRSRSRSKSRHYTDDDAASDDHKIDKKKLLEIAQKNAAQMAQLGYLPNATPEVAARMRTGMQSVDQLVDFCQKLQRSQEKDDKADAEGHSSDEEGLLPRKKKTEETTDFVKHPFALKPAAPITINITNAAPLPIKTPSQRVVEESQLRLCYPVSSGQQHREKDNEWVPVKKDSDEDKKGVTGVTTKQTKNPPDSNGTFLLPPPPKPPVLLPHSSSAPSSLLTLPPPPPPPPFFSVDAEVDAPSAVPLGTSNPVTIPDDLVFQEPSLKSTPANVGKVLAKRLDANKRLCDNPNDFEALRMLKEAEEQINAWAASKNLPGKFSGSTGVNVLSADQLGPEDPRYSAWAKKDLFKSANRVTGGVGLKLMQKMGWTPGEGLGKDSDGPLEPLTLDIKSDRKGLVAVEDLVLAKKPGNAGLFAAGKHPVSMLMELCTKKHWSAPQFSCTESGPPNNRRFLWKAMVNGVEYQPALPSNNKKTGKAQTCQVVLQSLGLVPKDPSLPVVL